ncbi:MAG: hypothetical protein ACREXR_05125, partial [Gammaproteobacteria bacterium]
RSWVRLLKRVFDIDIEWFNSHPISPPSRFSSRNRQSPLAPHSHQTSHCLDVAPRADEWPGKSLILDRDLACLTHGGFRSTSPFEKKGRLKFLFLP